MGNVEEAAAVGKDGSSSGKDTVEALPIKLRDYQQIGLDAVRSVYGKKLSEEAIEFRRKRIASLRKTLAKNPNAKQAALDLEHALTRAKDARVTSVLCVAPTGAGKGTVAAFVLNEAARKGNPSLFVVHTREIVEDIHRRLTRAGADAGIILAGHHEHPEKPIQVCSVQTLFAQKKRPKANFVVWDECFPAGTLIDGRPIETIREGDTVGAFDHTDVILTTGRVVKPFRSRPNGMVRVVLSNGCTIACTTGHPFYVADVNDYIPAVHLHRGDRLMEKMPTTDREVQIERVEHIAPTADGTFGGVCPDGFVYNIEVEEHHNYFAHGILVHNCHHAVARTYRDVCRAYPHARHLGLSATPKRSDGRPLGDVFDAMVELATTADLTRMGWLVPAVIKSPDTHTGETLSGHPVAKYREHADGKKAILFAVSKVQAAEFASEFNEAGIPAMAIDDDTPKTQRKLAIQLYREGQIRVLVNVAVLCLDSETEILTSAGWTGMNDMTPEHLVANWDVDGKVTFEKPSEVVRRPRMSWERMVTFDHGPRSRLNVRVTEGHRMLYRTLANGQWKKLAARDLVGRCVNLPVSGQAAPATVTATQPVAPNAKTIAARIRATTYTCKKEGHGTPRLEAERRVNRRISLRHHDPAELTLDQCKFIGFWLGDGTITKLPRGGVDCVIHQSMRYHRIVRWFDKVLSKCDMDVRRTVEPKAASGFNVVQWSIPRGTGGGAQQRRGIFSIEPYLNMNGSELLWGLNSRQFAALLEGFWKADGNHRDGRMIGRRGFKIYNTNKPLLDLLQAIGTVRGYKTRLQTVPSKAEHSQMYTLLLRRQVDYHLATNRLRIETAPWKAETVWCVKTRTKNLITRRHGVVTVMGNTEGFDAPETECVILAKPYGSDMPFLQACGRGLRASPETGKQLLVLIDLVGNHHLHGTPAKARRYQLFGKPIELLDNTTNQCPDCKGYVDAWTIELGGTGCPECGYVAQPQCPSCDEVIPSISLVELGGSGCPHCQFVAIPSEPRRLSVVEETFYTYREEQLTLPLGLSLG